MAPLFLRPFFSRFFPTFSFSTLLRLVVFSSLFFSCTGGSPVWFYSYVSFPVHFGGSDCVFFSTPPPSGVRRVHLEISFLLLLFPGWCVSPSFKSIRAIFFSLFAFYFLLRRCLFSASAVSPLPRFALPQVSFLTFFPLSFFPQWHCGVSGTAIVCGTFSSSYPWGRFSCFPASGQGEPPPRVALPPPSFLPAATIILLFRSFLLLSDLFFFDWFSCFGLPPSCAPDGGPSSVHLPPRSLDTPSHQGVSCLRRR